MAPGLAIHISRSPHNVKLLLWGRAVDGWWGLVNWEQRIMRGIEPTTLAIAAWVPAQALSKPGWSSGDPVARITLDPLRHHWPAPVGWTGWFAGAWVDGPLQLPPGVEQITGPGWRTH